MLSYLLTTAIHAILAVAFVVSLVAVFGVTKHDMREVCKVTGWGWNVYHSDSQKYFYCMTKRSALEWMGATYADAVMFSNWTKEPVAIVQRKNNINFA